MNNWPENPPSIEYDKTGKISYTESLVKFFTSVILLPYKSLHLAKYTVGLHAWSYRAFGGGSVA